MKVSDQRDPTASGAAASERLADYLDAFGLRLRRALWLRAAAVLALAALLLTIGGAWLAIRTGFGGGTLALVRIVLLLTLAALIVLLLALPLRRLRQARAAESLAHEFDGRLGTFADLQPHHPFRNLLAEDALAIAARHPPQALVTPARLALPAAIAVVLALALLWLAAAGPGLYRDGTRVIWAGWLLGGLVPAEGIDVAPGNQAVRRGGNVTVRSRGRGFEPQLAELHARVGNGPWQQIDMSRDGKEFDFTFFSVRDPVSYYVSAAGIRSATFELKVVDVPNVDQLRLVYHYPAWTGRPAQQQDGGGDISAIAGTHVEVQMRTDRALAEGELVLDRAATRMAIDGNEARGAIDVSRDARYFLATRIGGEQVRLTDDYLIKLLAVPGPQVHVTWPGRDYAASNIEEVTTDVQATDDYGLRALELHYSVNGGAWQTVALPVNGRAVSDRHVLALESLRVAAGDSGGDRRGAGQRALAPGDLISYYAVARGHAQSAQSDMYFINVQPYDRRFSQSQASGGGGGDSEQQQIVQRQREILVSTWNLLRQRQEAAAQTPAPSGATSAADAAAAKAVREAAARATAALQDNAGLLSTLQNKLASQAQTLAGRTQARQLVAADPKIARFVDSMQQAAKAMQPAAKHLAATELDAAIAPEQQALQYLMRAAAQFTDVQIALQRGGGGQNSDSGRDLSQIYQLEMDLQKNQYESGNSASPEQNDRQADELGRRLQSLAQREQQLANQIQPHQQPTQAQRWQQQSLQREAEQLQRQIDQLQQQQQLQAQQSGAQSGGAAASGGSNGSNGSNGSAGATGSGAASGAASGAPGGTLASRLNDALQAMNQAQAAMGQDSAEAADQTRNALQQAQRSLQGAQGALTRERAQAMQQAIGRMAERAGQLYAQQASAQAQLQAAARSGAARAGANPLTPQQQAQLTEQKRELSAGVQRLDDQIASAARQYRSDSPQTADALTHAGEVVNETGLTNQLDIGAEYIDQGQGTLLAPSEGAVTQGLRELQNRLQAAATVAGHAASNAGAQPDPLADELARVRALRQQLQQLADAAQTAGARGAQTGAGARGQPAAGTQRQGQQGQGQGQGQGNGAGQGAVASGGNGGQGGGAALLGGGGFGGGSWQHGLAGVDSGTRSVAAGATGLVPLLRAQGANPAQLANVQQLARQLGEADIHGRDEIATQLRRQLTLLEQLELELSRGAHTPESIRAAVANPGAEQYQQAVAEYYRRLGQQSAAPQSAGPIGAQ